MRACQRVITELGARGARGGRPAGRCGVFTCPGSRRGGGREEGGEHPEAAACSGRACPRWADATRPASESEPRQVGAGVPGALGAHLDGAGAGQRGGGLAAACVHRVAGGPSQASRPGPEAAASLEPLGLCFRLVWARPARRAPHHLHCTPGSAQGPKRGEVGAAGDGRTGLVSAWSAGIQEAQTTHTGSVPPSRLVHLSQSPIPTPAVLRDGTPRFQLRNVGCYCCSALQWPFWLSWASWARCYGQPQSETQPEAQHSPRRAFPGPELLNSLGETVKQSVG